MDYNRKKHQQLMNDTPFQIADDVVYKQRNPGAQSSQWAQQVPMQKALERNTQLRNGNTEHLHGGPGYNSQIQNQVRSEMISKINQAAHLAKAAPSSG